MIRKIKNVAFNNNNNDNNNSNNNNNSSWYVRKGMLRKVGEKGTVKVDKANNLNECKKNEKRDMEHNWKEKQMQG